MKPSPHERKAFAIADALLRAMLALEKFPGDPDMILEALPPVTEKDALLLAAQYHCSTFQAKAALTQARNAAGQEIVVTGGGR